jgi:hypothetical protein
MPAAGARRLAAAQIEARRNRLRSWRIRNAQGIAIARVPYDANIVSVLVQLGYLNDGTVSADV